MGLGLWLGLGSLQFFFNLSILRTTTVGTITPQVRPRIENQMDAQKVRPRYHQCAMCGIAVILIYTVLVFGYTKHAKDPVVQKFQALSKLDALCAGITYCSWLVLDNATNSVVYPRGPQTGYKPAWIAQARLLYERACEAGSDDVLNVLKQGSLLGAVVGGDWSHDNDFDMINYDSSKNREKFHRDDVCACFYGNQVSVCAKSAMDFVKKEYGSSFWMWLPETKNIGPNYNTLVTPDVYINWHGRFFVDKGNYEKIYDHWHTWRQTSIADLSRWDTDSDGTITTREVHQWAQQTMSKEWISHANPCLVHNAAVYCNAFLKYLRKIETWFKEYPFSGSTHARHTKRACQPCLHPWAILSIHVAACLHG